MAFAFTQTLPLSLEMASFGLYAMALGIDVCPFLASIDIDNNNDVDKYELKKMHRIGTV